MTALEQVATEYGVTPEAIVGPSRRADVVAARWAVVQAMRMQGATLRACGGAVHRGHAAVIHALREGVPHWAR